MVKKKTKAAAKKKVTKKTAGRPEAVTRKTGTTALNSLLPRKTVEKSAKPLPARKKKLKSKIKFKSVMLREEAISYFEAIVAGLKRGSIQIRQGEDALVLKPTPQLDVTVKAASKDQDEHIEFEIGWRKASDSELTISTD